MAENLVIPQQASREEKYIALWPQLQALVEGESDYVANLANIAAALHQTFSFFWVGFYLVRDEELVLGPFQGPIACTRIAFGKGVCGTAWKNLAPILVPNVEEFPGHIACSSQSKSEVVIPIQDENGAVVGVLDVDSNVLNDFTEMDVEHLRKVSQLAAKCMGYFIP
jgi:L-methionine (R)-S-oxide reductase